MKKLIAILLATVALTAVCACTTDTPPSNVSRFEDAKAFGVYEVNIVDNFNDDAYPNINHKNIIDLNDQKYIKENSNKIENFAFKNKKYNLKYQYSLKGYQYQNDVDYYEYSTDKGFVLKVGINNYTGKVDKLAWSDKNYLKDITADEKSHDECLDIARAYLAEYVDDPEAYTVMTDEYLEIPEYKAIYDFEFVRMSTATPTSDRARIAVTAYGDIKSHVFSCLGTMKDSPSYLELASEHNGGFGEKLASLYENIKDSRYELTNQQITLVKLDNGAHGAYFLADVEVYYLIEGNTYNSFNDIVELFQYFG